MSQDEVRSIVGQPHWIYPGNPARGEKSDWHYVCDDALSVLSVVFDQNDKVKETWQLD
jgi:hypothetical protein